MAMECPKCGGKAIVAEVQEKRFAQGDPITQFRTYVCQRWSCLHGFVYKNSYMKQTERLDTAQFIRRYERMKERQKSGQEELNFESEDEE